MDAASFLRDFHDHLACRLDTYEQAIYLYVIRHSRLMGEDTATIGFKSARKKIAHGKSVEQEALDMLIHKKKLQEQESQLREMILYRYGTREYSEMMQFRKQIREERDKAVYAQQRRKKKLLDGIIIILVIGASLGALISAVSWMLSLGAE